jgi:hypothetical protein
MENYSVQNLLNLLYLNLGPNYWQQTHLFLREITLFDIDINRQNIFNK